MKIIILIFLLITSSVTAQIDDFFTIIDNWNLKSATVNGVSLEVPTNTEVFPITISFSEDVPNYTTTVCGVAMGELATENGTIVMFTSDVEISDDVCDVSSNTIFQDAYFEFFSLHANEALNYITIIVDFAPSQESEYILIIEASNGDELFYSDIPLLSIDKKVLNTITITPNPTKDIISIHSSNQSLLSKHKLFDTRGSLLQTNKISASNVISLRGLAPGIYFLEIEDYSGNKTVKRIVKN